VLHRILSKANVTKKTICFVELAKNGINQGKSSKSTDSNRRITFGTKQVMLRIPVKTERLTRSPGQEKRFGKEVALAEQEIWLPMLKRCEMALWTRIFRASKRVY
jgi:hypothetical protein